MRQMSEIRRSPEYEAAALSWMFAEVVRLKSALSESGVTDEDSQRRVCESFFFGLAVELDDSEVLAEPRARRRVAFEEGNTLLLPDDRTFLFHEYVFGVVGEVFGEG